jgi:hypothetical protein
MQDASGSLFSAKFMLDNDLKTNCAVVATDNQGWCAGPRFLIEE